MNRVIEYETRYERASLPHRIGDNRQKNSQNQTRPVGRRNKKGSLSLYKRKLYLLKLKNSSK